MCINYPNELEIIFKKFTKYHIKPIIVGGYIRDQLLFLDSKDIDIELYGVNSFESIENILQEFGSVNSVGKSFGVCKLQYKNLDLDFSLPREDSKISLGHKGFSIQTYKNLDFTTAANRRDFTINAIGYDVADKKILDPFKGQIDLKNKILRAVDIIKFDEDPLRVLRAIAFSARFELTLDTLLFQKCKTMFTLQHMHELPKERIFGEIEKLLLKAQKPSIGLKLLKELNGFLYFKEFASLTNNEYEEIFYAVDRAKPNIYVMLALLCHKFSTNNMTLFLQRISQEKSLIKNATTLVQHHQSIDLDNFTHYDVYILATKVNISLFCDFLQALYPHKKTIHTLFGVAQKLDVLYQKSAPLLLGRDLMALGLKPSKKYSEILNKAYEAQLQEVFITHKDAVVWLEKNI